jgi:hypothetical protein
MKEAGEQQNSNSNHATVDAFHCAVFFLASWLPA